MGEGRIRTVGVFGLFLSLTLTVPVLAADDAASPKSVVEIQDAHDRALVRDLAAYIAAHPKAGDLDQAYSALFDQAIKHDWFAENEALAVRYLAERADGEARGAAQIVGTMARADAGDFREAFNRYKVLMAGLGKPEQEEFAENFTRTLASSASGAGDYEIARKVYQTLVDTYASSAALKQKVKDDLNRLDLIGKPAPAVAAKDVKGDPFRIDSLKGKYVLIDFWATNAVTDADVSTLRATFARYHERGFEVVGVCLDPTKDAVLDYVKSHDLPWRQIHNASSEGDMVEAFGVSTIPASFLIDPAGTISRIELRGAALDRALAKLLGDVADAKKPGRPAR